MNWKTNIAFSIFFCIVGTSCNLAKPLPQYSATNLATQEPTIIPTPTVFITEIPFATDTSVPYMELSTEVIDATLPVSTIAPGDSWYPCKDAYASRLQIGIKAQVSEYPPLSNRIRSEAGTDNSILGTVKPGEIVVVLDGPKCLNNWVWWKVRSEKSKLEGWTSEGDYESYWLVPLP